MDYYIDIDEYKNAEIIYSIIIIKFIEPIYITPIENKKIYVNIIAKEIFINATNIKLYNRKLVLNNYDTIKRILPLIILNLLLHLHLFIITELCYSILLFCNIIYVFYYLGYIITEAICNDFEISSINSDNLIEINSYI